MSTNFSGCDVCSRTRTARIFAERFCGYWREGGGDLFFGTWANTQQQTTHIHGTSESTSINNQHWSLAQILNSRPQIGYTQSWSINLLPPTVTKYLLSATAIAWTKIDIYPSIICWYSGITLQNLQISTLKYSSPSHQSQSLIPNQAGRNVPECFSS